MDKATKLHFIKYALYTAGATFCACRGLSHLLDAQRIETRNYTCDGIQNAGYEFLDWIDDNYPETGESIVKWCNDHKEEIQAYFDSKK